MSSESTAVTIARQDVHPLENPSAKRSGRKKVIARIITYIGAIIIFATFVVKDVMRERLKDLNDSMNSAEMFYLTQTSIEQTQMGMADMEMTLGTVNFNIVDQKAGEIDRYQHQIQLVFATAVAKFSLTEQYIKNLTRLIQKLPHDESQQKQVDSLLARCAAIKTQAEAVPKEADAFIKKYRTSMEEDESPPPGAMARMNALLKQLQAFQNDSATFGTSVQNVTDSVLANAHQIEEKSDHQYSWATVASYMLYSLGWILAFAGRVFFGTDGPGEP